MEPDHQRRGFVRHGLQVGFEPLQLAVRKFHGVESVAEDALRRAVVVDADVVQRDAVDLAQVDRIRGRPEVAAVGLLGRVVPGDVTVVVVIADGVEEGDAEFADQRAVFREPEAVEVHVLVEDHVADRQPVDPAAAEFGDGFREVGDERVAAARERRLRNHQAAGVVDLDVGRGQQHVFVRAGCRQCEVVAVAAGVEQVVELRDGPSAAAS